MRLLLVPPNSFSVREVYVETSCSIEFSSRGLKMSSAVQPPCTEEIISLTA